MTIEERKSVSRQAKVRAEYDITNSFAPRPRFWTEQMITVQQYVDYFESEYLVAYLALLPTVPPDLVPPVVDKPKPTKPPKH